MDKEQLSSIKRYVNSKTSNIQKTVDSIEKKLSNLNSVIVKICKIAETQEKKIKNITLYQYKIMKLLDNFFINNNQETISKIPVHVDIVKTDVVSKKEDLVSSFTSQPNNLNRELKKEIINFDDDEFIKKNLINCDINSDINLFKHLYLNNCDCPIRYINKNNYQYWVNGKWNDDFGGEEIVSILVNNIKKLYIKINTYKNFKSNLYKYQTYIYKMNEKKYKDSFIKLIKELVRI